MEVSTSTHGDTIKSRMHKKRPVHLYLGTKSEDRRDVSVGGVRLGTERSDERLIAPDQIHFKLFSYSGSK